MFIICLIGNIRLHYQYKTIFLKTVVTFYFFLNLFIKFKGLSYLIKTYIYFQIWNIIHRIEEFSVASKEILVLIHNIKYII